MIKPFSALQLPSFFSSHMVVQRDEPIPVHGHAVPDSIVTVSLMGLTRTTRAGKSGKWRVVLPPVKAGRAGELAVTDGRSTLVFTDILAGDVWFCSGQSNMEWTVRLSGDSAKEIAAALHPAIRQLMVDRITSPVPSEASTGSGWKVCTQETAGDFTAAGYYFAREVNQKTGIPIGLVNSSWGGSPIEPWMPAGSIDKVPRLAEVNNAWKKWKKPSPVFLHKLEKAAKEWTKANILTDPGNTGEARGWAAPDFDDSSWKEMNTPGCWESHGLNYDGCLWFRRQVAIPTAWKGKELRLELGPVDDYDTTYFNGVKVGGMGPETLHSFSAPRVYPVPRTSVRAGRATIAVRVFDIFNVGGFIGVESQMRLFCPSRPKDKAIPLSGPWKYMVEWVIDRNLQPYTKRLPGPPPQPGSFYNSMVAPYTAMPIKGFLWYQGESNVPRAEEYGLLFPALIRAWRKAWKKSSLPFYFVQLANFQQTSKVPADADWAELREAQNKALRLPHTGAALAIDIGDTLDIHPINKQEVGRRLALLALNRDYKKKTPDSGPSYVRHKITKAGIQIFFDSVDKGLGAKGRRIAGFALAGRDRKFHWADARIASKSSVLVSSRDVLEPMAIRYAWANNPVADLQNSAGLPASPFRTDKWPGLTTGRTWPAE